jgi:predicted CXXCH cytochrome family protein
MSPCCHDRPSRLARIRLARIRLVRIKAGVCSARIVSLLLLLAGTAFAVEHPGTLHKDDNCSSCHASKTSGKFVHADMGISCTTCHLAQTRGDMTTLSLLMPKERLCFACHENSPAMHPKTQVAKQLCVDCHDSHTSDRRMLLRDVADARPKSTRSPARSLP